MAEPARRICSNAVLALLAAAIAGLIIVVGVRWGIRYFDPWRTTVPDVMTRRAVAGLKPDDVAGITVQGPIRAILDGPPPSGPFVSVERSIVVTDRAITKLLLEGLQEAVVPDPTPTNRIYEATIRLRGGKTVGPFGYVCQREIDAFSPKFVAGLRAAGIQVPWEPELPP